MPARASREREIREWKRSQSSSDANAGRNGVERLDVTEREPVFLKDKGDAFFKAGDYRSALEAYARAADAERAAPHPDGVLIKILANRAACLLRGAPRRRRRGLRGGARDAARGEHGRGQGAVWPPDKQRAMRFKPSARRRAPPAPAPRRRRRRTWRRRRSRPTTTRARRSTRTWRRRARAWCLWRSPRASAATPGTARGTAPRRVRRRAPCLFVPAKTRRSAAAERVALRQPRGVPLVPVRPRRRARRLRGGAGRAAAGCAVPRRRRARWRRLQRAAPAARARAPPPSSHRRAAAAAHLRRFEDAALDYEARPRSRRMRRAERRSSATRRRRARGGGGGKRLSVKSSLAFSFSSVLRSRTLVRFGFLDFRRFNHCEVRFPRAASVSHLMREIEPRTRRCDSVFFRASGRVRYFSSASCTRTNTRVFHHGAHVHQAFQQALLQEGDAHPDGTRRGRFPTTFQRRTAKIWNPFTRV